jgi:HD superfamily phosphodiesterase
MVNTNMGWSKIIHQLFQKAGPYLNVRGDKRHAAISHRYSLYLMKHEGGNHKVIEPAVILHDVGWFCIKPQELTEAYGVRAKGKEADRLNRIHEVEGAAIAQNILAEMGFETSLIDEITAIIKRHDSGINAYSLEEKVTRDADKMWRFSKIGFWTEKKRQGLDAKELYDHLAKHYRSWFFTLTALKKSQAALFERLEEMKSLNDKE